MTRKEMSALVAEMASNAACCTRILAISTPTAKEKIVFWTAVERLADISCALSRETEFPAEE